MPYDSNGNFTRVHNWEEDRQNDIDIVSDRHDEEDDNFADGLSDCFLRDGRATMTGDLKMGGYQLKNLAAGSALTDGINKQQLETATSTLNSSLTQSLTAAFKKAINSAVKVGDVKTSTLTSNHDNWLLCNGQQVSRTTYSALFAIIGTRFGGGNGSTTFNVPDYRGKFIRGLGGDSAGNMETTQAEGLPNITGQTKGQDGYLRSPDASGAFQTVLTGGSARSGDGGQSAAYSTFDARRSNAIYGNSAHVTPINQALNFFIKAKDE